MGVESIESLIAALTSTDYNVRKGIAEALGKIGDMRAVEPLICALEKDELIRYISAKALGNIADRRAVEPLIAALKDHDESVRRAAVEALGKIGDVRAVDSLISALKDDSYHMVRCVAASGLGRIGDKRAGDALYTAALEDGFVRSDAAKALEQIGDARAKEWDVPDYDLQAKVAMDVAEDLEKMGRPGSEKEREFAASWLKEKEKWLNQMVDRLVAIYSMHGEGFVRGTGGEPEKEIRHIGKILNAQGGMRLMLDAHEEFSRRSPFLGAPRNLELMWDRVGDWRG